MSVSGGSKSKSGSAQDWAKPFATSAAGVGQQLFNENQPMLQQLTSQVAGMMPGLNSAFDTQGAMIRGNANSLNGLVPQLQNAFGTNYNNMQDLAGTVSQAGGMAMQDYAGPNAATMALPAALRRLYSGGMDPTLGAAQNYTQNVLGGQYLNGNPYLDAVLNKTRQNVTNQVNSQYSLGGRYGSGAHVGNLTSELSNAENAARMADYNSQMGRMDQAAQTAGQLSGQQSSNNAANYNNLLASAQADSGIRNTSYGQAMTAAGMIPQIANSAYMGLNPLLGTTGAIADQSNASFAPLPGILNAATTAAQLPYAGYNAYTNGLGTLFNGGVQKTSNGIGGILQGVGSLASGAGAMGSAHMFSDRRLKRAIRKLGKLADGLGVYEWTYAIGGPRMTGVMADEVAKLRPWALGPKIGGYRTVNYEALEAA